MLHRASGHGRRLYIVRQPTERWDDQHTLDGTCSSKIPCLAQWTTHIFYYVYTSPEGSSPTRATLYSVSCAYWPMCPGHLHPSFGGPYKGPYWARAQSPARIARLVHTSTCLPLRDNTNSAYSLLGHITRHHANYVVFGTSLSETVGKHYSPRYIHIPLHNQRDISTPFASLACHDVKVFLVYILLCPYHVIQYTGFSR